MQFDVSLIQIYVLIISHSIIFDESRDLNLHNVVQVVQISSPVLLGPSLRCLCTEVSYSTEISEWLSSLTIITVSD